MSGVRLREAFSHNKRLVIRASILLILLLPTNMWLSIKMAHIKKMLNKYECKNITCEADFNGDGEKDTILIDQTTPSLPYYTSWLTIKIHGKEELRLPFRIIDGSLRTHIATLPVNGRSRLLIADPIKVGQEGHTLTAVFAWNDDAFRRQQPSNNELELLSAMIAFDDAGYGTYWLVFTILEWPTYLLCLLLLFLILKALTRPTGLQ
jgi:hypothetical protein